MNDISRDDSISEDPVYKYLEKLMFDTYSLDLIPNKEVFKKIILDMINHTHQKMFDKLDFGEFSIPGSDRYILLFRDLIRHFHFNLNEIKGKRILDIGPAFGGSSLLFLALGAKEVIAIDPDPVNILRIKFLSNSFNLNLVSIQTTFEEFKYDSKFDFINCFGVFYFIKNQKKSINKMYNLLNPYGKLYIETKTTEEPGNIKADQLSNWLTESNFIFRQVDFSQRTNFLSMKGDI